MRLTDDKIDLNNKVIKIITLKTNKEIVIPISDKLMEVLKIFKVSSFVKDKNAFQYNSKLKRFLRDAGIIQPIVITRFRNSIQEEIKLPKYSFMSSHTARRTFITKLVQDGVPPSEIMKITGHTSRSSFDKYILIEDSEAIDTIRNKLNSW